MVTVIEAVVYGLLRRHICFNVFRLCELTFTQVLKMVFVRLKKKTLTFSAF